MGGVYVCQCTNSAHLRRASSLDKGSELEFKVVKPHKYFSKRLKSICSKNKCKGEILCQDHSLNERIQHVSKYLLSYYQKTLNVKIAQIRFKFLVEQGSERIYFIGVSGEVRLIYLQEYKFKTLAE